MQLDGAGPLQTSIGIEDRGEHLLGAAELKRRSHGLIKRPLKRVFGIDYRIE